MKKNYERIVLLLLSALLSVGFLAGCNDADNGDDGYLLKKEDISVNRPDEGFKALVNQPFRIEVKSVSDEGVFYEWSLGDSKIADSKNLEYTFTSLGTFTLTLHASQGTTTFDYDFEVKVTTDYVLKKEDITIEEPEGGFRAKVDQLFRIEVTSVSDDGVSYLWFEDEEPVAQTKNLEHMFSHGGAIGLKLTASQGDIFFDYYFTVFVEYAPIDPPAEGANPYITKVFDYMPAVGQFTNTLPLYEEGDTQETMNQKVLDAIGNNKRGMITLGGFGGYVTVGFDHTIQNVEGLRDFRVLGNAFYANANPNPDAPEGGSCEPGVIMVAYDPDNLGPDNVQWYEIQGSAHVDPTKEPWYEMAKVNGNDVNIYFDYRITYYRPDSEPTSRDEWDTYIKWEDNQGNSGYKMKNQYHSQPYYPLWAGNTLSFTGTCLPQNAIDESGSGTYFVLYKFRYGYADNEINSYDDSSIDISWAVDASGNSVNLPGVDYIKIYTGVNQENGWLGECSTEIMGVEDLHLLKEEIHTRR